MIIFYNYYIFERIITKTKARLDYEIMNANDLYDGFAYSRKKKKTTLI